MSHIFPAHSFVEGHDGCFYGVDIFSRAVVNFVVPVSFSSSYSTCISLRVLAQYRGIAGTEAITVFRIGRTLYAVFHGLLPAEA